MKTPFATRLAAALASVGTTFVMLWAVVSLSGTATEESAPVVQAPVVVATAER